MRLDFPNPNLQGPSTSHRMFYYPSSSSSSSSSLSLSGADAGGHHLINGNGLQFCSTPTDFYSSGYSGPSQQQHQHQQAFELTPTGYSSSQQGQSVPVYAEQYDPHGLPIQYVTVSQQQQQPQPSQVNVVSFTDMGNNGQAYPSVDVGVLMAQLAANGQHQERQALESIVKNCLPRSHSQVSSPEHFYAHSKQSSPSPKKSSKSLKRSRKIKLEPIEDNVDDGDDCETSSILDQNDDEFSEALLKNTRQLAKLDASIAFGSGDEESSDYFGDKLSRSASVGSSNEYYGKSSQKRTAHLSAEFRYRTKLNDKINKLRMLVGHKSHLSKSAVLSRSIETILKMQKILVSTKGENEKLRQLVHSLRASHDTPTTPLMPLKELQRSLSENKQQAKCAMVKSEALSPMLSSTSYSPSSRSSPGSTSSMPILTCSSGSYSLDANTLSPSQLSSCSNGTLEGGIQSINMNESLFQNDVDFDVEFLDQF